MFISRSMQHAGPSQLPCAAHVAPAFRPTHVMRPRPVTIDLTDQPPSAVSDTKPPAVASVQGPLKIRFPAGLTKPPQWLRTVTLDAVDFPDYRSRVLRMPPGDVRVVRIGGDEIQHVFVPQRARVTMGQRTVTKPVSVGWFDKNGDIVRHGPPDNQPYTARSRPSDAAMPRNGDVSFAEPQARNARIICRDYSAALDRQHSLIRGVDAGAGSDARDMEASSSEYSSAARLVEQYADFARVHFGDPASVKRNVRFADEARFTKLFAMSRNPALVAHDQLGSWAAAQFEDMKLDSRRTFLVDTIQHVMTIALEVRRREDGRRSYSMVLQDPNRLTAPSAIETSRLSQAQKWSMRQMLTKEELDSYFNRPEDGIATDASLIVETPRGADRQVFEASTGVTPLPLPAVRLYPPDHRLKPLDLVHFDLLGHGQERVVPSMRGAPRKDVETALLVTGNSMRNMATGDPASIARHLAMVGQLHGEGIISAADVGEAVQTRQGPYSLMEAVEAERPEPIRHYRDAVEALMRQGALTYRESECFDNLFDPSFDPLIETAIRSGTPRKAEAAQLFLEVRKLASDLEAARPIGRRSSTGNMPSTLSSAVAAGHSQGRRSSAS